jgi:hypothetical protein
MNKVRDYIFLFNICCVTVFNNSIYQKECKQFDKDELYSINVKYIVTHFHVI